MFPCFDPGSLGIRAVNSRADQGPEGRDGGGRHSGVPPCQGAHQGLVGDEEENEKIDCVDALVFGLNRTAAWRQKMAARYPRPDVPVIMITAYGDPDTKRKAIEGGAEGFLIKPIDFTLLREEIDTRLEPAV